MNQPLAFSSDSSLVAATSRLAVETKDGALLNVEIFEKGDAPVLLLVIPGICESAETKGVQALVAYSEYQGTVAVLELEGHGLSSGTRGYISSAEALLEDCVNITKFAKEKHLNEVSIVASMNAYFVKYKHRMPV